MKLSSDDLFLLSQCAISAAYQAGHLISQYQDRQLSVEIKTAGSSLASQVVTEVDLLSQKLILQNLLPTCKTFDLGLLAEEEEDNLDRLEKDFFWCIDPLDGTLPFTESTQGYAVSIALVSRTGIPQIGVVYDPVKQTLYHAVKGCGAFRNGKEWNLEYSSDISKQSLTFISDRSFVQHHYFSETITELKTIASEMGYKGLNTVLHGGAVMNACWVLEREHACYFKYPKAQNGGGSLWDYSATACIFSEASTVVSDIHGKSLNLNNSESTFMNHSGILYTCNRDLADRIIELYQGLQKD
ncbi:MAG: myo-inositol-1(or 4)-monophosphatase [bacterium]|jgi:myo-inositol-1(or 4)-monophosphatase